MHGRGLGPMFIVWANQLLIGMGLSVILKENVVRLMNSLHGNNFHWPIKICWSKMSSKLIQIDRITRNISGLGQVDIDQSSHVSMKTISRIYQTKLYTFYIYYLMSINKYIDHDNPFQGIIMYVTAILP